VRIGWVRFFVIVVLFAPLACAQVAGTVINKPGPEQGAIVSNIYANEFLGFSFPIPDGWEVNREILGTEREGEAKRTPGGGLELLVVDQHTAKPFRNRIVVSALDATSMSATTQEYVSKFAKVQVNRDGRELVRDAFDVELAGKHFFRADYKQPIPGGALAEAFVCTKFRGYFIGWTFVAGSPEELEGLVNSLQRLAFRDELGPMPGRIIISHPPAGTAFPRRVRVSQRVSESFLTTKVVPEYPDDAKQARIQGSVVLKAEINKNGDVEDLTVVSGHPMLAPAAIEAVKQWKYRPYLLNGQPVAVETQVTVAFQLSPR